MNMKAVTIIALLGVSASMAMSGAARSEDMSFSELSNNKASAKRLGTFLGILSACESHKSLVATLKETNGYGMLDLQNIISASQVRDIITSSMEVSGLDLETLSSLDDIIQSRTEEVRLDIKSNLEISEASQASLCGVVLQDSYKFTSFKAPEESSAVIPALAALSPITQ